MPREYKAEFSWQKAKGEPEAGQVINAAGAGDFFVPSTPTGGSLSEALFSDSALLSTMKEMNKGLKIKGNPLKIPYQMKAGIAPSPAPMKVGKQILKVGNGYGEYSPGAFKGLESWCVVTTKSGAQYALPKQEAWEGFAKVTGYEPKTFSLGMEGCCPACDHIYAFLEANGVKL